MLTADEVWNRAAMAGGGRAPRQGDVALASVLSLHSLAMSGSLVNAVEHATHDQLEAAEAGYRWLGLETAAGVIAMVRQQIEAGALEDDDRAQELEERGDEQYAQVIPADQTLVDAFRARWEEERPAFAPV